MSMPNGQRAHRILLAGATVVTIDDDIGVIDDASLLVEGDRIASITTSASASAAGGDGERIDASGFIVCLGCVNALERRAVRWRGHGLARKSATPAAC